MTTEWVVRLDGLEPNYDVDISRSGKWGNPFVVGVHGTRSQVIDKHRLWIKGHIKAPEGQAAPTLEEIKTELQGKRLGCFCKPKACHGDFLALIANEVPRKGLFKRS